MRRAVLNPLIAALLVVALLGLPSLALADSSYTVKSGDTLTKIAKVNNTTIDALVAANKAKYPCLATNAACLQIGWVITIPGAGGSTASNPSAYTVLSGDSLSKIAKKLGVDYNALIAANKKDRPCLAAAQPCPLQIGWVLNVPGGVGAPAPAPTAKPAATAAPNSPAPTAAAPANNGVLMVVMCQVEASIVIFHDGQIITNESLHNNATNIYSLPVGHYDVQFSASNYSNLNISVDIVAGGVFTETIGHCG